MPAFLSLQSLESNTVGRLYDNLDFARITEAMRFTEDGFENLKFLRAGARRDDAIFTAHLRLAYEFLDDSHSDPLRAYVVPVPPDRFAFRVGVAARSLQQMARLASVGGNFGGEA